MKKIVWIDVGTHFGQEYNSIFGTQFSFYLHLIKRFLSGGILKRGKFVSSAELKNIINARSRIRRRSNDFHIIFIEANSKIISSKKVYLNANEVYNLALLSNSQDSLTITKLYLGFGDELSQGSSIFSENDAVDTNTFVTTMGISCDIFFPKLKKHIENLYDEYEILLRLNCEGVEDDVIYSADKTFGPKIRIISGSLNDVKRVRGKDAYEKLVDFLNEKNIPFVFFSPLIYSWPKAYSAILKLLDER